jgi:hypothetical protein
LPGDWLKIKKLPYRELFTIPLSRNYFVCGAGVAGVAGVALASVFA